ncbi:MAG: hypothetical protein H3C45_04135 [Bacteroidia bacterium]|nr:hypothetical protein [Bacteroidia bacterium]MCC7533062.1 hypothetical protein [Bacteroidia bacterium]
MDYQQKPNRPFKTQRPVKRLNASPKLLTKMHTIINKVGVKKSTDLIVSAFTTGGNEITSTKQLTRTAAEKIILFLQDHQRNNSSVDEILCDTMRKIIMKRVGKIIWRRHHLTDIKYIHNWILREGLFSKPLHEHNFEELYQLLVHTQE